MIPRALLAALVLAAAVRAQGPNTVTMQSLNARDILYLLGGGGANALALMRDDGVVLIDTKLPGWGQSIANAIAGVSDKPVTTIINTNADADHTGGNVAFPAVVRIIAHQKTKARMRKMEAFQGPNARFLPNETVTDKLSLLDGLDRIDLYYFGAGHTDGDLVVVYPEKHVAYLGDLFPSKAAPLIDTANGGSGVAFPQTLAKAVAGIKGVNQVITGHYLATANPLDVKYLNFAQTMTWNDLREYADFNRDFLAAVQEAIRAGRSADEAAATLKLPDKYKDYDMRRAKENVQMIYTELKK